MPPNARLALAILALSLGSGAGGFLLIRTARAMPGPDEPDRRVIAGTVVEVLATPCSRTRSRGTCFRPVVAYDDGGQPKQVAARTIYREPPLRKGERVEVFAHADGTAWISTEWAARQAVRQSELESKRRFPLWMGRLLVGCGALGALLALGLLFFVDRSDTPPA